MDSRIREALENLPTYNPAPTYSTSAIPEMKPAANYGQWVRASDVARALALLDAPAASDAREVWNKLLDHFEKNRWHLNETFCLRLFESALSDCERKAREETARKCAEAAVAYFENMFVYGHVEEEPLISAIMEAAHG